MFSAIKALFGSSKSVDKVITTAADGIYKGIDMLVYTDEEKAIASQKGTELFLRFTEKALDQNQIRSVTRRWLAFIIVGPMMVCFIASGIAFLVSTELATHLYTLFTELVPWGAGILVFYFGPHLIGSIKK